MKQKFDIGKQLNKSLESETEKNKDKFSRADEIFSKKSSEKPLIIEKGRIVREGFSILENELNTFEELRFQLTSPGFFPTKSILFRAMISFCKILISKDLLI
jgi:hypothetical protein